MRSFSKSLIARVHSYQKRAQAIAPVSRVVLEALENRQLLSITLPATPKIVTTASPAAITLNGSPTTLTDTAVLTNGFNPTGNLVFTLRGPGNFLYTQIVPITGDGTYTAHDTLPANALPGTYRWTVTYAGDTNNNSATDQESGLAAFDAALPLTATEIVTFPGAGNPPQSYFSAALSNAGTLNGTFPDWCVDPLRHITTGTPYFVDVYSSAGGSIPAGTVNNPQNFPEVNYLLNQNLVGKTASDGQAFTFGDVQEAIWTLIAGPTGTTPGITFSQNHVDQIVTDAKKHSDFVPGPGQLVAVVLRPVDSAGLTDAQVNIIVVRIHNGPRGTAEQTIIRKPTTLAIKTTQLPANAVVGSSIADKAIVTGGINPTGTVTFRLYNNPNGTGTPLTTDTEPLVGGVATSAGYIATAVDTDYWVATYNGDSKNAKVTSGIADEPVHIRKAGPVINTTQLPADAIVGDSIADKATVTGGFNPTGTVTFRLFNNPNGTGTPLTTDTEALVGGVATSAGFIATAAGTDYWVATYNGDSKNASVTSGIADEPVHIRQAGPAIDTTQLPASAVVGSSIADKATVTGGNNPTGTVTFQLFNNPNGTGTPLTTDTEPLAGGVAISASYIATAVGTDYWVATYNGDSKNASVTSGTGDEPVRIRKAKPAIDTTQLPTKAIVGDSIADKATVTGGFNPTGTVTFRLFNNPNGTGTPLTTDTEPLVGGVATSAGFIAAAAGTDYWVATYNGDSRNSSVTSGTGDEPVTIGSPKPGITIVKSTNGVNDPDANAANVVQLAPGAKITWSYLVTDTGNTSFTKASVLVTDSQPGVAPAALLTAGGFVTGDSNQNNMLDPGETWTYQATGIALDLSNPPAGVNTVPVTSGPNAGSGSGNFGSVSLGAAAKYAVVAVNGFSINGPGTINGDVASGDHTVLTHPAVINGTVFYSGSAPTGDVTPSGGEQSANLAPVFADAEAAQTAAFNLAPTQSFGALGGGTTIQGNGGVNVINVSGINMSSGSIVLKGSASDVFILNVHGNLTSSNSNIAISGGLTADHVLINVSGSVTITGGGPNNFYGTILDPNGDISVHDKLLTGELIGNTIIDTSGFSIDFPPPRIVHAYENIGTVSIFATTLTASYVSHYVNPKL